MSDKGYEQAVSLVDAHIGERHKGFTDYVRKQGKILLLIETVIIPIVYLILGSLH